TSGGVGLHVYLPLNTPVIYAETKAFAHAVARMLEREHPDLVTSLMPRERAVPSVSTPVSWEEVAEVAASREAAELAFLADSALRRADAGDLFAPVLSVQQRLPEGRTSAEEAACRATK
ncbi:MAG: hypothetical protein KY439_05425, partial [Actinobacteria bacterium]|nr:hypothetical protein [Actinomycetota bacterium]